jgi:hypothetical protein
VGERNAWLGEGIFLQGHQETANLTASFVIERENLFLKIRIHLDFAGHCAES